MARDTAAARERIRAMSVDDVVEVLTIERASFPAPWPRSAFDLAITVPDLLTLVAEDDVITGYVVACFDGEGLLIANLAVAPERRRRGLGQRLLTRSIGWGRALGARSCHLDVRVSNRGAQKLYSQLGFVPAGIRPGYYNHPPEDALTMFMPLEPLATGEE